LYMNAINDQINNSYPDGDSNHGVALLVKGNLTAGNKRIITVY